jgi:hypothetical protein
MAPQLETLAKDGKLDELVPAWQAFEKELSGVFQEVEQLLVGALP